jgi:hypothetical protein
MSPVPLLSLRRRILISQMIFACSNIVDESIASDFLEEVISQMIFAHSNIVGESGIFDFSGGGPDPSNDLCMFQHRE